MKVSVKARAVRILSTLVLVTGCALFAASCSSFQVVAVGDAELEGMRSGISPMNKEAAAEWLQQHPQYVSGENCPTNRVTTEAVTIVSSMDDPVTDPLLGITLARPTFRHTVVCAWKDATDLTVARLLPTTGEAPYVRVSLGFSRFTRRDETVSAGGETLKVHRDGEDGRPLPFTLADVSDAAAAEGYTHRDESGWMVYVLPNRDLLPLLSAVQALTGLAPKAAPISSGW